MNLTDKQLEKAFDELAKCRKAGYTDVEVEKTGERVYTLRGEPTQLLPANGYVIFDFANQRLFTEQTPLTAWIEARKFDDWAFQALVDIADYVIDQEEKKDRKRRAIWSAKVTLGIAPAAEDLSTNEKTLASFFSLLGL